jgi:hypothetical protein
VTDIERERPPEMRLAGEYGFTLNAADRIVEMVERAEKIIERLGKPTRIDRYIWWL